MNPPSPLTLDDYESIEQAVMETERGRWFLAEFARRNRAADTGVILEALGRLEGRLAETRVLPPPPPEPEPPIERIAPTLAKLADAASRLRSALDAPAEAEERVELAVSRIATLERAIAAVRNVAAGVVQAPEPSPETPALAALEVAPEPVHTPLPGPTFSPAPKSLDVPKPEPVSSPEPVRTTPADDVAATREAKREARIRAAQARMQARAQRAAPLLPPRAPQPAIPPAWSRAAEERVSPPRPLAPGPLSRALLESLSDVEKALLFA
ncbi:hypothetical protein [Methylopila sp. Yamaguchi]|uniref:hypothetical protein n=1 Tax=Methylopila sp. Yamaguchi TaxID=1437817 RepID=UPI000CCA8F2E|nr:hypothetical protein [Methylopila sp. Yamaguchi]GBD48917.1 hypothetical protein METY_2130 [Methylopila sp. Yamaguchi]